MKFSSAVYSGIAIAILGLSLVGTTNIFKASALPALSVDSAATGSCNGCTSQSASLSVMPGDVVIVLVSLNPESVYDRTPGAGYDHGFLSSMTSTGMTFQQRFAYTRNPGSGDGIMAWEEWAVASSSGISSISATVNSTNAAWSMIAYSITGANETVPFDRNPSLPHSDFNDCNSQDGCAVTYSTSNSNDMVLLMIGCQGGPGIMAPSGYNLLGQSKPTGWQTSAASYLLTTSPQTEASSGNWVLSPGESAIWFVDAVQAASASSSTTTSSSSIASSSVSTSSTINSTSTTTSSTTNSTSTTTSSTTTSSTTNSTSTSSSSTTNSTSTSTSTSSNSTSTSSTTSSSTSSSSTASTTEQTTTEVSSCIVTFTLVGGNVTGWTGSC